MKGVCNVTSLVSSSHIDAILKDSAVCMTFLNNGRDISPSLRVRTDPAWLLFPPLPLNVCANGSPCREVCKCSSGRSRIREIVSFVSRMMEESGPGQPALPRRTAT